MKVVVRVTYEAAHYLPKYGGKCRRLHGHRYHVEATFDGEINPESGMVLDMALAKECLRNVDLDHQELNAIKGLENPTAENMAIWIGKKLLSLTHVDLSTLSEIKVWKPRTEPPLLHVTEIFSSIQGEGRWAGTPCVFIRLAGCSMGCEFCDTQGLATAKGTPMTVTRAVHEVLQQSGPGHIRRVVITGGEPLQHPHIGDLINELIAQGRYVEIETNGAHPWPLITKPFQTWLTVSPKPKAGWKVHHSMLRFADAWKFVVTPDFDLSCIPETTGEVYLQPMWGDQESLATTIRLVMSYPDIRLSLQTHKFINLR